ncbi:MAG: tetratricopeptide repeat protein [Cyanobacteria bacterium P01_F01_bin.4]
MYALYSLFFNSFGWLGLLGTAFWIWMLYECLKSGKDRQWIWLLIFLNVIGAVMYFIIHWLPQHPNFLARFGIVNRRKLRDKLWQAEADAKNIGNATQYVTLGNTLFDMRQTDRAYEAYQQALEKEPENPKALWGAAQSASEKTDYAAAKEYLARLLKVKPDYSYGEASLAYGEVLCQMEEYEAAVPHLQGHLKNWSNPEAYLMLATLQENRQEPDAARETLETMILKIKGFVPFQYRKNEHFIRKAERKLKALPKAKA